MYQKTITVEIQAVAAFDVEKGQVQTWDQEGHPDRVISYSFYPKQLEQATLKAVDDDFDDIEDEFLDYVKQGVEL